MSQPNADYRAVPSVPNPGSLSIEHSNEPDQDVLDSIGEVSDVRPLENLLM